MEMYNSVTINNFNSLFDCCLMSKGDLFHRLLDFSLTCERLLVRMKDFFLLVEII